MAQKDIKYINKDFSGFKQSLIEYAKSYFPEVYNDFTEASPGSMFIEMASYVGDVLSFYLDKQAQENFLIYAQDKQNLIAMAYALGYKPKVTSTATVDLEVTQQLPATIQSGVAYPDFRYAFIVNKESKVTNSYGSNVVFVTEDTVDFSFSSSADPTEISVSQINGGTNQPEYFLAKKKVKAIAGTIKSYNFEFGEPIKFNSVTLPDNNIIEILDVTDSDGNKWYEVPNLAQSTIFSDVRNTYLNDPNLYQFSNTAPYLLKLKNVQRRFVSRFGADDKLSLEFGSGILDSPDEEIVPNPDNVGMGLVDSISKMTSAYDPSNFLFTKDYGLSPSNTTLTVRYLVGGGVETNVPSNTINQITELNTSTVSISPNTLNQPLLEFIRNSIAFNNPTPSSGGGSGDTVQDIRLKTMANFPTQMRNVTKGDHIIRALSMPPKFGTIAKAYQTQDASFGYSTNSNPLGISLYVLSYDSEKKLQTASRAIKENLKSYISLYNITTDGITIKDAYIINIGVNFDITVLPSYNNRDVLSSCITELKDYFSIDVWQINQPIVLSEIYSLLRGMEGVQSVQKVEIVNKYGESDGYSKYGYDIVGATKNSIIYPSLDLSIFEVKHPDNDIYGRVINY